jgi:hypothetical protein
MTSIASMTVMSAASGTTLGKNYLSNQSSAPFSSFARSTDFGTAKFENERSPYGVKVIGKDNVTKPDVNTYFAEKNRPDNAFGRQIMSTKQSPGVISFFRDDSLEKTKEQEEVLRAKMQVLSEKAGKDVGPGAYNTDDTDKTRRHARAPAFTMGEPSTYKPTEEQIKVQHSPGPGHYSVGSAIIKKSAR